MFHSYSSGILAYIVTFFSLDFCWSILPQSHLFLTLHRWQLGWIFMGAGNHKRPQDESSKWLCCLLEKHSSSCVVKIGGLFSQKLCMRISSSQMAGRLLMTTQDYQQPPEWHCYKITMIKFENQQSLRVPECRGSGGQRGQVKTLPSHHYTSNGSRKSNFELYECAFPWRVPGINSACMIRPSALSWQPVTRYCR